jgi:hypothetical protein
VVISEFSVPGSLPGKYAEDGRSGQCLFRQLAALQRQCRMSSCPNLLHAVILPVGCKESVLHHCNFVHLSDRPC